MERTGTNVAYIYELNNGGGSGGGQPPPSSSGGPPPSVLGQNCVSGAGSGIGAQGMAAAPLVPPQPPLHHHLPSGDNYCLRWNDYEKKYAETFRLLRDDEYFTDVTLATEGHSVKAHRVILSACSNYFHAILKTMSPWQHPVLLLQDVRSSDLNSLMDFIYFGQASVSQDSLQSFLRVAEKLKIKGLCESLAPPPPLPPPLTATSSSPHSNSSISHGSLPAMPPSRKELSQQAPILHTSSTGPVPVSNFEGLLSRSPYIPEPSVVPLSCQSVVSGGGNGSVVSSGSRGVNVSSAPPPPPVAHQSPRQSSRAQAGQVPTRQVTETLVHYAASTPKRPKYAAISPQSILRSQLQIKDQPEHVEVKSEPMAILPTQEEVPSSGVNVTEFISTHENDLALQSLGQSIGPQFMFSPDPSEGGNNSGAGASGSGGAGQPGVGGGGSAAVVAAAAAANGPPPPAATLVAIDDKSAAASVAAATMVTALSATPPVNLHTHMHHHSGSSNSTRHDDQPQDLTPGPQDSPAMTHTPPAQQQQSNSSSTTTPATPSNNSPSTPTPPKKDRNSRKTCAYCHKDFHEMSLKRHIKDVHFRSQNTYVICPQCCKQYASQNSLYSHLNRVHGVKKEMMPAELQLHMGPPSGGASGGNGSNASSSGQGSSTPTGNNHHDGIMDLAHHSDNSN